MGIVKKTFRYLIVNIRDRKIVRVYDELLTKSTSSIAIIKAKQLEKIGELIQHAYNNVPYYSSCIKQTSLVRNQRVSLTDIGQLSELPILTKDIIRREGDKLISRDSHGRRMYRNPSGGSTGEPVEFMQDADYFTHNMANTYLAKSWRGCGLYDSTVVLWGAERDTFKGRRTLLLRMKDFFFNTHRLNTFLMSDADKRGALDLLNKSPPSLVVSYIQSIYELARYAKERNLSIREQRAIHAAAGTVYDFMRDEIEAVFKCRLFNHYGSREVGPIASECSAHDGLHVMADNCFVEVVDDDGNVCVPGQAGNIVVTSLNNYSMPLIRYKIGDVGSIKKESVCACGCGYPMLEKVSGRSTDLFRRSDGVVVDGEFFTHLFYFIPGIKLFQVIQEGYNHIVIKLVCHEGASREFEKAITEKIVKIMGGSCCVQYDYVSDIPKTSTGKFVYTRSNIK